MRPSSLDTLFSGSPDIAAWAPRDTMRWPPCVVPDRKQERGQAPILPGVRGPCVREHMGLLLQGPHTCPTLSLPPQLFSPF